MTDRQVTHTGKDAEGDITKLCKPGEIWSPRYKAEAISDIESKVHTYYVGTGSNRVNIHVVNDPKKGKYLRTDPDKTSSNNLDDLPDC